MAAPRRPSAHAPVPPNAADKPSPAPSGSENANPDKPLQNVRTGQPDEPKSYFPRYGSREAHDFFVQLGIGEFLDRQTGKIALKMAKAWSHFMQAALGVAKVQRQREDVRPEAGDAPDVAEFEFKSKSPGAEWNSHYDMVAAQMHKSGASTYSS